MIEQGSIETKAYTDALWEYSAKPRTQRLGQFICNHFKLTEEQAPGLWESDGHFSKSLFFKYFSLH